MIYPSLYLTFPSTGVSKEARITRDSSFHFTVFIRKLLSRLLIKAPVLMRQCSMRGVLEQASLCDNKEVTKLGHLVATHMDSLSRNDAHYNEDDFYILVKEVRLFNPVPPPKKKKKKN